MKSGYKFCIQGQGESLGKWDMLHGSWDLNFFLDPTFWQSLGKALGWDKNKTFEQDGFTLISWKREWHSFIDTLASGQTPEKFFADLLAK